MILINCLSSHSQAVRAEAEAAIARVLGSGWFVLGPEVAAFEKAFADYVGVQHSVSLANGTDAIEMSLKSLGIKEGDHVATVANAGMYTATALFAIGAEPIFMDVDLASRTTNIDQVRAAVSQGAKAVVVTHLYGAVCPDIVEIAEFCRAENIPLVEDCAQAHGARLRGKMAGSFGDVASFSFYPTKNLGALGDGGAVVTNSDRLAATVRQLRQYGWSTKYEVVSSCARNSRLDELQAAILNEFLPLLDTWNQRRREIATTYAALIKHHDILLPVIEGESHVAHLYVLRCPDPKSLQAHLKSHGIASEQHYPIPDHRQPVFEGKYAALSLPNTEILAKEILTIPCFPELTDDQVRSVAAAVNSWTR